MFPPPMRWPIADAYAPKLQNAISAISITLSGLGSILNTISEDTANLYLLNVSWPHFQPILIMVPVSKYLKDTEDTAPHVSVSVS